MYVQVRISSLVNLSSLLTSHVCNYSRRSSAQDLLQVLRTMPKDVNHTAVLKKKRQQLKEKNNRYIPGIVTIKVLGSGAKGAPRSLYVFTDQSKYLFNCGEGTQRLAQEHRMKLSKLEHIFITHPSWENIGGLPGVALTIQDVGVPEVTIHGPAGINEIFTATRRFVILRDLSVKMADCSAESYFEDNVLTVKYVPLTAASHSCNNSDVGNASGSCTTHVSENILDESEDDVDYYAHQRKTKRKHSGDRERKRVCTSPVGRSAQTPISMSYICHLKPRPGALCLERCVEKGVPPGPLLGKLKAGEDVVLDNGTVVRSADVRLPDDPGPVFIVVDCPSLDYVDSLIMHPVFYQHQATAKSEDEAAHLVAHFTPLAVMADPRYQHWMEKFFPSTHHLLLNEGNDCMGSLAVHRIQYKLHLLHSGMFPLLYNSGMNVEDVPKDRLVVEKEELEVCGANINDNERTCKLSERNGVCNKHSSTGIFPGLSVVRGKTFYAVHLRPKKILDRQGELSLNPKEFIDEAFSVEGFEQTLTELQQNLRHHSRSVTSYPKIVFLGTGSCIPNKTRNTSGILLHTSESSCILLDCGEGTYGQLVRFYGPKEADRILCNLKAVYVSHLHADHHLGLIGILKGRRKALNHFPHIPTASQPIYLLAPKQIMFWLNLYDRCFEPILQEIEIFPNGDLEFKHESTAKQLQRTPLLEKLNMSDISTVLVRHCPNAFGIALKHCDGWKMTYSGDTMPCAQLVELGQDSDLLIHEATMEDDLENEAWLKLHSTTSQAIDVGNQMKAKFILLTHFSQRYAKLPRFNNNFASNVGIAFDNLQVHLEDLPLLPLMYPSLRLMFAEDYEEMEQKAARRHMKQERERENKMTEMNS